MGSIFFYNIQKENGIVNGYGLVDVGGEVKYQLNWRKVFPNNTEVITNYCQFVYNSYLSVKVLGDSSYLYKYLNPNLIAVVTNRKSNQDISNSKPEDFITTIYIIDTVSGQIIHQILQKTASGPVSIVAAENWVVYSYWNTKGHRFEISVVELYKKENEKNQVKVLQQSYVFPNFIKKLDVTKTKLGISNKQILATLDDGHVMSLDKRFLDPRRPTEMTPEAMKEGLIPYIALISNSPKLYINYYNIIEKLKDIETSPSNLESTSLVAIYGLDFYFTHVSGGKIYDRLDVSFNEEWIILILFVFLIIAIITSKIANRRIIYSYWK